MENSFFKYLNIGPTEQQWGMYVTTAGYSKIVPNETYPSKQHPESHQLTWNRGRILNDYYMVFISKGKGVFGSSLTASKDMAIEEGTCFFLFPGVWHRYRPDVGSGWEEYWVGFNGYYAERLMKSGIFDAHTPCIDIGLDKELLLLFQKMMDAVRGSFIGYAQQIAGMTIQMLGVVHTIARSHQHDQKPVEKAISKARFLLQESLEAPVDMQELARRLPMGYSAFRKHFKAITGQSPNQYHLNLRIERARELLESTLLNVAEVSEQTGFDSIHYFSRIFRKKVGQSPNAYRKTFL